MQHIVWEREDLERAPFKYWNGLATNNKYYINVTNLFAIKVNFNYYTK